MARSGVRGLLNRFLAGREPSTPSPSAAMPRPARAPRIRLLALHDLLFKPSSGFEGHALPMTNLSTSGVAFLREAFPQWPAPGAVISGQFAIGGTTLPASFEIIHHSPSVIGARFVNPESDLPHLIHEYFRVELSALGMLQVPPDMLQQHPRGTPMWFHGRNNCELFALVEDDRLLRYHLSFFANYVEGAEGEEPRFGEVVEDGPRSSPRMRQSNVIRWKEAFPPELMSTIERFVENIPALPPTVRAAILDSLFGR